MKRFIIKVLTIITMLLVLVSCREPISKVKENLESVQTGPKEILWNIGSEDIEPLPKLNDGNFDVFRYDYEKAFETIKNIRNKSNSQSINYILDSIIESEDIVLDLKNFKFTSDTTVIENNLELLDFYNKNSSKLDTLVKHYIENTEKSYKSNEIVRLKPEITGDKIAILYPDHFKTISGLMKVLGAQITLITSYSLENRDEFRKLLEAKDAYDDSNINYEDPKDLASFVNYLKTDFRNGSLFNKNLVKQANALTYMKNGVKELEFSLRAIPVFTTEEEKLKNILALKDEHRNSATYVVEALSNLLKDGGGIVELEVKKEIDVNGETQIEVKKESYTVNLNKLYQLDIKDLVQEFLAGTDGISDSIALQKKIDENIDNSTIQGLFPNKKPKETISALLENIHIGFK